MPTEGTGYSMRATSKKSDKVSQLRIKKARNSASALPTIVLPQQANAVRLPSQPFSEREHVRLLYEAAGLHADDLKKVKDVLLEALQASQVKDITVSEGKEGARVQRVSDDIADHDTRLEAADKLLKLFDLYPSKGKSIIIEKSNVMVNPKFVKK